MSTLRLYLHAARAARARQLLARAARPLRRRRFPQARSATFHPIEAAAQLWRSPAFDRSELDPRGAGTRLYAFHQQYGEDVLESARAGDGSRALEQIETWIAAHPPEPGDAWHPYVVSTRVGNWIAATTLQPALATPHVMESLGRQMAYVAGNVEDDILGNHVIRNARALVLGGIALGSDRLLERGLRLVRRELPEQVLPDGGHYERSPVYHSIVLRDLLEIAAASGESFLAPVIDRMARFAAALARPDGAPALFNDGALDLAPALDLPPSSEGLHVFRDTGYAVLRTATTWLAFDCGPPAPSFLPPHAHADALSFQLWMHGRPIVIDTGAWTYEAGPERNQLRGTAAHSTVSIADRDQFELWGAFRSGPFPPVRLVRAGPDGFEGEVQWPHGAMHRRRITWSGDEIRVADEVYGAVGEAIISRVPLAESADMSAIDAYGGHRFAESARRAELLFAPSSGPVSAVQTRGGSPSRLGWVIDVHRLS